METMFYVGEKPYAITFDSDTDSRVLTDEDWTTVLTFDSSLNVIKADGKPFGRMEGHTGTWVLVLSTAGTDPVNTGIAVRDYHWKNILDAEVFVSEYYVQYLNWKSELVS